MSISGTQPSVLGWHVHGAWMESFVAGPHRYLLPVTPARADEIWPRSIPGE